MGLYVHTEGVDWMHVQLLTLVTSTSRVEGREGKLLAFSLTLTWYAFYVKSKKRQKKKKKGLQKLFSFEKKKSSVKSRWAL